MNCTRISYSEHLYSLLLFLLLFSALCSATSAFLFHISPFFLFYTSSSVLTKYIIREFFLLVPQEVSLSMNSCNAECPYIWSTSTWMRTRMSSKTSKFGHNWKSDTLALQTGAASSDPLLAPMGGQQSEDRGRDDEKMDRLLEGVWDWLLWSVVWYGVCRFGASYHRKKATWHPCQPLVFERLCQLRCMSAVFWF